MVNEVILRLVRRYLRFCYPVIRVKKSGTNRFVRGIIVKNVFTNQKIVYELNNPLDSNKVYNILTHDIHKLFDLNVNDILPILNTYLLLKDKNTKKKLKKQINK